MTTLIPTAFSWIWMYSASLILSLVAESSRCTLGFEMPDSATSFLAWSGSYASHGFLVAAYQAALDGETRLQLGCASPLKTTLLTAARSSASSNACRSFALVANGL